MFAHICCFLLLEDTWAGFVFGQGQLSTSWISSMEPGRRNQLSKEDKVSGIHGLFLGSFVHEKPLLFRKLTDENMVTFTYVHVAVLIARLL